MFSKLVGFWVQCQKLLSRIFWHTHKTHRIHFSKKWISFQIALHILMFTLWLDLKEKLGIIDGPTWNIEVIAGAILYLLGPSKSKMLFNFRLYFHMWPLSSLDVMIWSISISAKCNIKPLANTVWLFSMTSCFYRESTWTLGPNYVQSNFRRQFFTLLESFA